MVLVVPKAFILNSLLDSKLSDSLFIINSFIMYVISINVKKYQKNTKNVVTAIIIISLYLLIIIYYFYSP